MTGHTYTITHTLTNTNTAPSNPRGSSLSRDSNCFCVRPQDVCMIGMCLRNSYTGLSGTSFLGRPVFSFGENHMDIVGKAYWLLSIHASCEVYNHWSEKRASPVHNKKCHPPKIQRFCYVSKMMSISVSIWASLQKVFSFVSVSPVRGVCFMYKGKRSALPTIFA